MEDNLKSFLVGLANIPLGDEPPTSAMAKAFVGDKPSEATIQEKVIADYTAGKTLKTIAYTHKVSMGKIYTIITAAGIAPRTKTTKVTDRLAHLTDDDVKGIIHDYEHGKYLADIYSTYNIHKNGLYHILDAYSITRRSDTPHKRTRKGANQWL